jgi:CheY-like chemotaxis protein
MSEKSKILIIDDDVFMREMVEEVLSEQYQICVADNGEEAVSLAKTAHPDLILLDVEMPGMDGYETCLRLKQQDETAAIPVIFVSARDQIDERLKGYEVGGNDYVIKPFNPQELKAKIAHLLGMISERKQFKEMASYATNTAMTAMTSMSEMGALLESLKNFNASADDKSLCEAVLLGLVPYGLSGVIQVSTPERIISLSAQGEASPLEISVIQHMAEMDRITQFKTRMSIHYPHVSMLVNNMPVEDPDRCGRLRDHLAMLIEGAEMRASGIIAENESRRRGLAIEKMAARVTRVLNEIDSTQRLNRAGMRVAFSELTDKMDKALMRVALTTEQEAFLSNIVTDGVEDIINTQSDETELQNKLTAIVNELKSGVTS